MVYNPFWYCPRCGYDHRYVPKVTANCSLSSNLLWLNTDTITMEEAKRGEGGGPKSAWWDWLGKTVVFRHPYRWCKTPGEKNRMTMRAEEG